MLWSYTYQNHALEKVQGFLSDFINTASREAIPASPFDAKQHCSTEFQPFVDSSKVLKKKLKAFYDAFVGLDASERSAFCTAFSESNVIEDQLNGTLPRHPIDSLPASIRSPTSDLFKYLYKTELNRVGDVKDHWRCFFRRLNRKDCPFCAMQKLLDPVHFKQDYDHLLCKNVYPLAAVNMKNLVPMCIACNRVFKKTQDLIFKAGARRKAFAPFKAAGIKVAVSLVGSTPPTAKRRSGAWKVSVAPTQEEVQTWLDVFNIVDRYDRYILRQECQTWIDNFNQFAAGQAKPTGGWTLEPLRDLLRNFARTYQANDYRDCNFLRAAFYDWLHSLSDPEFLLPTLRRLQSA